MNRRKHWLLGGLLLVAPAPAFASDFQPIAYALVGFSWFVALIVCTILYRSLREKAQSSRRVLYLLAFSIAFLVLPSFLVPNWWMPAAPVFLTLAFDPLDALAYVAWIPGIAALALWTVLLAFLFTRMWSARR